MICHDSRNITTSVRISAMALLTTPDNVQVNARCAPITSLLSRLTSAPVRVRVKKATGIRWTWPKTARRRSRIRPSPIFDDCQRSRDADGGVEQRDERDRDRDPDHPTRAPVGDDLVDDLAGEHRRGDRQHG